MKYIILITTVFILSACTTLQPVEQSPQDIQAKIISGDLLNIGDNIRVITIDGISHTFRINEITDTHITGSFNRNVVITEIATLEVRKANSTQNTLLLIGVAAATLTLSILHQPKEIVNGNF